MAEAKKNRLQFVVVQTGHEGYMSVMGAVPISGLNHDVSLICIFTASFIHFLL